MIEEYGEFIVVWNKKKYITECMVIFDNLCNSSCIK